MNISIVTAILNSSEIARRQLLHYNQLNLDGAEVIFVDDGSIPALNFDDVPKRFQFTLLQTNDFRPWTQPAARNMGARAAQGDVLILTDIDHIIPQEIVNVARDCPYDVVRFHRQVAVLDEHGDFTQDWEVLRQWGYTRDGLDIAPHGNSCAIKRSLYLALGGVSERFVGTGKYPNREELPLKAKLKVMEDAGEITVWQDASKPTIFMFPNGKYAGDKDANPFGMFHTLSRRTNKEQRRLAEVE